MFYTKIKNLQCLGDVYELQPLINQRIENDGLTSLIEVVDDLIAAASDLAEQNLLILSLIDYLFPLLEADKNLKAQILEKFHRHRASRDKEVIRLISFQILATYQPRLISQYLVDVASDQLESSLTRKEALKCLELCQSENISFSPLLNIFERQEEDYIILAFKVFEKHYHRANFEETQKALETLAHHPETNFSIRCNAIELLGLFGDMDLLERLCLLRNTNPALKESLNIFMDRLFSRPINVLKIRPANFEHLIKDWLIKSGYRNVAVTREVKDGGIDITAEKDGFGVGNVPSKVIVQCKRHSNGMIGSETLKELENNMKKQQASAGLLVTTSTFSRDALKLSQECKYIELVDRGALQQYFDEAFGEGRYCIGNH